MKVALYARYSSDNQRDASIEDQLRLCRRAISGASLLRPGIHELISDAMRGKFVVVLAEAMDRLSRAKEDITGLFKRMAFGGMRIVTLSEGDVTHLHVGLKRTMNALPQGPGRQDAPRAARPRRGRQVRWRALLRL
jgi:site-specific DNA recombinase